MENIVGVEPIAGIVSSVGEGVSKWKEGDRIIGTTGFAGLAEKALYYEHQLMPLPKSMDFKTGAVFPCMCVFT